MDITQLIFDDHYEQRRLFAILEQVNRADTRTFEAIWARLSAFVEVHAAVEEETPDAIHNQTSVIDLARLRPLRVARHGQRKRFDHL